MIKKAGPEYLLDGKSKQEMLEEEKNLEQEKAKNLLSDAVNTTKEGKGVWDITP